MSSTVPIAFPWSPDGLIFDLDGTLVDSFADIAVALNRTREHFGWAPLPEPEVRRHVGSGSRYLVKILVPVEPERADEAYRYYLADYRAQALVHSRLYPGAEAVLERFADRPLAVVTNKNSDLARIILQGLGVWQRFALVLGGDALPSQKPDALPLRHVLKCFGLPPGRVAMIGDGLHDLEAGRAAGVVTVGVSTGVESRESLAASAPHLLIDSLEELLHFFC